MWLFFLDVSLVSWMSLSLFLDTPPSLLGYSTLVAWIPHPRCLDTPPSLLGYLSVGRTQLFLWMDEGSKSLILEQDELIRRSFRGDRLLPEEIHQLCERVGFALRFGDF